MFYFKVETLNKNFIVKSENLKEIKKEYDKIINSCNYFSLTPIKKKKNQ